MNTRIFTWSALLFGLIAVFGCGSAENLPPGGFAAVRYWHAVLQQYPDLPARVRDIVEKRSQSDWQHSLPQAEVHIYGEEGVVSVQGRRVNVVVTDLDDDTLRKLLDWWEKVPELARQLDLQTPPPFSLPESTRHVVVLGRQGKIQISGPGGYDSQTIDILENEAAGLTTIGVHAFGPEGDAAVEHLARQYNQVRGPPDSEVNAGRIALPPPEDNVTVLVIGRLGWLDIDGPADDAHQDITFAGYMNRHNVSGDVTGELAGTPFAREGEYVAELDLPYESQPVEAETEGFYATDPAPARAELADAYAPVDNSISAPSPILPDNNVRLQPPLELPRTDFPRPVEPYRYHMPPPIIPPVRIPVVVPRFGS